MTRETPAAPEGARCRGVTRSGEPCRNPPRHGKDHCRHHAPKGPEEPPEEQAAPRGKVLHFPAHAVREGRISPPPDPDTAAQTARALEVADKAALALVLRCAEEAGSYYLGSVISILHPGLTPSIAVEVVKRLWPKAYPTQKAMALEYLAKRIAEAKEQGRESNPATAPGKA